MNTNTIQKKQGMLRPIGIIAFGICLAILFAIFYWVAPWLIEQSIERTGTKINGAKVELDSVDISLSPAGLYLNKLQVTNSDRPMHNVFEFDRAYAALNLFDLWNGRVIVEDLSVDAIKFNTQRDKSGALPAQNNQGLNSSGTQKERFLAEELDQLKQVLPDTKELLSRHPLQTEKLKNELDQTYKIQKEKWDSLASKLPNEEKLNYYQREFKALTEGDIKSLQDFNQRKQKFDALRNELKQDKKIILQAKNQLAESQDLIYNGIDDLKSAPQKDWASIKAQYSFDEAGALNISGLLFGNQFAYYAEQTLKWYRKLSPMMAKVTANDPASLTEAESLPAVRKTGRFIHFGQAVEPDVLIRKASANAVLSQGEIDIEGRNLTHQQYLSGLPSTLSARAEQLNDIDSVDIKLEIDHRSPASKDTFRMALTGQNIDDLRLSDSENLPLVLTRAKMDLRTELILNNENISGFASSQFSQADILSEGQTTLTKEISALLNSIKSFSLDAQLGGALSAPEINLSSDLDQAIKKAFSARLSAKQKEWEGKLRDSLNSKLNTYLADNKALSKYFANENNILDGDLKDIDKLLAQKLNSFVDDQKQEVQKKLENKLKDKLKGLF
jgi:uncharacterized protein (TIGR03545 family)